MDPYKEHDPLTPEQCEEIARACVLEFARRKRQALLKRRFVESTIWTVIGGFIAGFIFGTPWQTAIGAVSIVVAFYVGAFLAERERARWEKSL